MLKKFNNETEETGKLIISYPMVEALKLYNDICDDKLSFYKFNIKKNTNASGDKFKRLCENHINANDIEKTYTQEDLIRIMKYHMLLCKHIYGMEIINFKEYEDKVCTLETFNHQRSLFKTHERCYLFSGIAEFVLNYSKEEFYPIITEDVSIEIEDLYD